MSPTLRADAAAFAYEDGAWVLRGVNAEVGGGRVTGIAGPNGSGKSTLLRLLAGLLRPGGGRVTLNGAEVHSLPPRLRARSIAFLPQAVSPAFALSVFDVVCLGRYPRSGVFAGLSAHDVGVVRRGLAQTDTSNLAERDFTSLSGGERQRVLLASVLAQEPELLLLDEPTSALDVHHQVEVLTLLRRLAAQGLGVAVVMHDLNLAARFCDEILLLGTDHQVRAAGAPDGVLTGENLSAAYGTRIQVAVHPLTGAPLVHAPGPERGE